MRFDLYAVKATGTLRAMRRDSPSQWTLAVPTEPWGEIRPLRSESYPYLESHEERFALYDVKATRTLRDMRRDSPSTQWKLPPVPWEQRGEIRRLRSKSYRYLESKEERFGLYAVKATGTFRPWEEIRHLRSKRYRNLESHEERFALNALKAIGTLRAMRRDSPSTPWKLMVPWELWGEIRPLSSESYWYLESHEETLRSKNHRYLESHEKRFTLYAVKGQVDAAGIGGACVTVLYHWGQGLRQFLHKNMLLINYSMNSLSVYL